MQDKYDFSTTITIKYLNNEYTRKIPEQIEDVECVCNAIEELLASVYSYKNTRTKLVIKEIDIDTGQPV